MYLTEHLSYLVAALGLNPWCLVALMLGSVQTPLGSFKYLIIVEFTTTSLNSS